jgi:hypothetical protein
MEVQFNEILISKELKEISLDLIENVLDNNISIEVLREIPILKSLVAVRKVYTSYSDRIFIKKAMHVLLELGDINWKERIELTSDLNDSDSTGAEKILMAIDKLETIKKCKVFGRLCKLKAVGKIDVDEFLRLTKLIQDAYLADLFLIEKFKKNEKKEISEDVYYPILNLGLIYQEPSEQMPIRRNHQYNESDPEFKGGEIKFYYLLTDLGNLLIHFLHDLFSENN